MIKKIIFNNSESWILTIATTFALLFGLFIFSAITPYDSPFYKTIPNPKYNPQLGEQLVLECYKVGHPSFGEDECDLVDKNPKNINDPELTKQSYYFFAFMFLFFFSIYSYFSFTQESYFQKEHQ